MAQKTPKDKKTIIIPGKFSHFSTTDNSIYIYCDNELCLKIEWYNTHIIRFRYAPKGEWQRDFSYAISDSFEKQNTFKYKVKEGGSFIYIEHECLNLRIDKDGLLVEVSNKNGNVLLKDHLKGFQCKQSIMKGVQEVKLYKESRVGAYYYGLGDKPCDFVLNGKRLDNWNTDAFGYDADTACIYRSVPFYISIRAGLTYGIFFDNTYRTRFDFDTKKKKQLCFSAKGGEMNYYFIYGQTPLEVVEQYTLLTGTPELPPLWALGYHQCRWSYFPEQRVRDLAAKFRAEKIPCDAIYLDIDYMNQYRCFTWNNKYFPNPKRLIADLKKEGFKTIVMIDPGLKKDKDYWVYQEGKEEDVYCKRASGEDYVGPVWPQDCVFPDFTNPRVRDWWGGLYEDLYMDKDIAGFWNDMNEPAVFHIRSKTFPDDVLHDYDGYPTHHKKVHNIYGMQMVRATLVGLKKLAPNRRPFVLSRANFSGGQRYAAAWTGDNTSTWEHLQIANRQCQRMSISGFSFIGSDIGGFAEVPSGELMLRWLQLGIFHPFFRTHTMGFETDGTEALEDEQGQRNVKITPDQEPWSYGKKYTPYCKAAIELRYQLLPYIYTAFYQYITTGTPMIRPLSFVFPQEEKFYTEERDFMFGDHLFVSPVIQKKQKAQYIYLPKGLWYDLYSGKTYKGEQRIRIKTPLKHIPLFVKGGAILPLGPVQQYVGEKEFDTIKLNVYYDKSETTSLLYMDEGEGYAYIRNDQFNLQRFKTSGEEKRFTIKQEKSGEWNKGFNTFDIAVYGLPLPEKEVQVFVDDKPVSNFSLKGDNDSLLLKVNADFGILVIRF